MPEVAPFTSPKSRFVADVTEQSYAPQITMYTSAFRDRLVRQILARINPYQRAKFCCSENLSISSQLYPVPDIRILWIWLSNMSIEQLGLRALDISCHASPSKNEAIPAFRRTSSAPGCLSTSTQHNLENYRPSQPPSSIETASIRSTSELRHLRALRDTRIRKIRKDDHPRTFSRSKSSGFHDISSFVRTVQDQDKIISRNCDSHESVFSNGVREREGTSSNCSLNDASPNDIAYCFSCLTAHDAAAIGVDMPSHRPMDSLELVSWNLASPNNNPFEFWVRG